MALEIEFDQDKNELNILKHGLPLAFAAILFADDYKEKPDDRRSYGEPRFVAIGAIEGRLCICAYTWRKQVRRIISLRKANQRERNAYHQDKSCQGGQKPQKI